VACPDVVVEACLIRPGATTHAFNQDLRYVPLVVVSQTSHHVRLRLEGDQKYAPPGNYLLFVLRNDNGRKVPSIARWVNVGDIRTRYATWDVVPPNAIMNLFVATTTSTSRTLVWTAPTDPAFGTNASATRYELRYRASEGMPTLDDFFAHGRRVDPSLLPTPGSPGTPQGITVTGLASDTVYYFRLISRDGAGSDRNWSPLSNEVAAGPPAGGGCPFVDTRTAAGWQVENSILGRSLTGALSLDGYRLKHAPEVRNGRVQLRVRENEQERTTLDQVRLVAVDHALGVRAFALDGEIVVGTPAAAERVTTSAGVDVTALFDGTGEGFAGAPGDTLVVEFGSEEHAVVGEERATQYHEPFHEGDGGKCPPDCGYPLKGPADPSSAADIDAQVLGSSGIEIQTGDGLGGWRTVLTRYPREHADEAVFEGVPHGPVRLVFVGRHTVRSLGRLEEAAGGFTVTELPLLAAQHTRSGDVARTMESIGGSTSELSPGDTLNLEFAWSPVPEGQVRELLLLSHGVYTAALPSSNQAVLPVRFAVRAPQPNPFAVSSALHFDLPGEAHVRFEVLDAQGRRIRVLANHRLPPGSHSIAWDGSTDSGSRAGPGVYFYRFSAGEHRAKGRFVRVP
jgi:hypothetical protein